MKNEKDYSILKDIVRYNVSQLQKVDFDQTNARGLIVIHEDKHGVDVFNPFCDTTGMHTVDPIEEYGEDAIRDMIESWNTLKK